MTNSAVEDVCIAWRKGLRRVWDLPASTHARLITPLCGLLQLKVELASCCVKFMANCLSSSNHKVEFVARQSVYFQRLYSPIGRKAQHLTFLFLILLLVVESFLRLGLCVLLYEFCVQINKSTIYGGY